MTTIFLNADEVRELTGRAKPADQHKWLKHAGWLHELNAAGRPIVLRSYAERRLSGLRTDTIVSGELMPNFDALRG